jgi:indoleamine 2,3-dioxygenase
MLSARPFRTFEMPALRAASPAVDALRPLADYGIHPQTGFVPGEDQLARLPQAFEAWEQIAPIMGPLIRANRIRAAFEALPLLDAGALAGEAEQERALLLLTLFANAWVWGGPEPHLTIPVPLAVPLCTLASELERPPITHYGSMALRNWRRVDPSRPLSADNAQMQIGFLGGVDEEWFYLASMGVELAGAPLLRALHGAVTASQGNDDAGLTAWLEGVADDLGPVMTALNRMREWCDPHVFYHRVRGLVAGWPDPGVVYEGVWREPRKYIGGSAGQSSLIQAVDAALGVVHDGAVTGPFFAAMRTYMPREHRRFVEHVAACSKIRARVQRGDPRLVQVYDRAIRRVEQFRAAHRRMAHDYITVPAGLASQHRGTGGTQYGEFLADAQKETRRQSLAAAPRRGRA